MVSCDSGTVLEYVSITSVSRQSYCSLGCEGLVKLLNILRSGFVNVFETPLGMSGKFNIERESV